MTPNLSYSRLGRENEKEKREDNRRGEQKKNKKTIKLIRDAY